MKSRGEAGGCYFSQLVFAVKGRCRHFRVARARMTAGIAVAATAVVVSPPARSIGSSYRRGCPDTTRALPVAARYASTRAHRGTHVVASASTSAASSDPTTDERWDAAWRSVRDTSTRVAFVDGDARDALRASLVETGLPDALAKIPGEVHLRAEVSTGDDALADVRGMNLFDGLFGNVDALEDTDVIKRGIGTLERDVAAVVRSFGETCDEPSAVVQISLMRNTLCSKYHVDWVPLRVMVTYFGAGTEVLSERASDAITAARSLGHFAEDAAKTAASMGPAPARSGECQIVLMKGERWPGNAGRAIVHRSPTVDTCCGEWRLCLRVDAPAWVNPAGHEAEIDEEDLIS